MLLHTYGELFASKIALSEDIENWKASSWQTHYLIVRLLFVVVIKYYNLKITTSQILCMWKHIEEE